MEESVHRKVQCKGKRSRLFDSLDTILPEWAQERNERCSPLNQKEIVLEHFLCHHHDATVCVMKQLTAALTLEP